MNSQRGLILWVAGFAGGLLLYAAYKGESPLTYIETYFGPGNAAATGTTTGTGTSNATVTTGLTPVTPIASLGDSTATLASTYSTGVSSGVAYVYDSNGNPVSEVPPAYQGNPATYIPGNM